MKRTPLKRKTPLRNLSRKRQEQYQAYTIMRPIFLKSHPYCEMLTCSNPSQDIHHKYGRRSNLLTDERYLMAVCRECHAWIHEHANEARREGLLL